MKKKINFDKLKDIACWVIFHLVIIILVFSITRGLCNMSYLGNCVTTYDSKGNMTNVYHNASNIAIDEETVTFYYNGERRTLVNQRVEITTE